MSNTTELIQGIRKARTELISNLIPQATITGADAAALVENRIVSKGERADGGKFSPYSTKGVAAFRYFGRSRNASGERAVRDAAKKKQEVSYHDFRRMNGLGTSIKNFQFTGEMWQGMGVVDVRIISQGVAEVTIGGKNTRTTFLLKVHAEREGASLTENSKSEIKYMTEALNERIIRIINRNIP